MEKSFFTMLLLFVFFNTQAQDSNDNSAACKEVVKDVCAAGGGAVGAAIGGALGSPAMGAAGGAIAGGVIGMKIRDAVCTPADRERAEKNLTPQEKYIRAKERNDAFFHRSSSGGGQFQNSRPNIHLGFDDN